MLRSAGGKGGRAAGTLLTHLSHFEYLPSSQVAHVDAPSRAEPSVVCVGGHAKKLVRLGDTKSDNGEAMVTPPFA